MGKKSLIFILVFFLCLICGSVTAEAEQNVFGLDTSNAYDIYISNEENAGISVIRNVTILETREIRGETFILIRSDNFASNLNEGVVRFSAIQAVLPSKRAFKVDGTTKFIQ